MAMEQKVHRISELPKEVVQHILSFLPIEQVVQYFNQVYCPIEGNVLGLHSQFQKLVCTTFSQQLVIRERSYKIKEIERQGKEM